MLSDAILSENAVVIEDGNFTWDDGENRQNALTK